MATDYGLTVYFDSGIETVSFQYGSNEYTFINSGAIYGFSLEPGSDIVLTANLKAGYSLESSSFGTVNGNTVTIAEENMTANMTCTLTSKSSTSRLSVDVSTLTGWANLSAGSHDITIVAKASGFKDSAPSAAIQVTKAASTKTLKAGTYKWADTLQGLLQGATFNFVAGNVNYTAIESTGAALFYLDTSGITSRVYFNKWLDTVHQTITLATDQQVSAEFYEWAITGGNLVKQAVDNGITTDTPPYTFNVDFNAAPGDNVSATSNQAYEAVQNYINNTGGSSLYAILDALGAISSELREEFESVLEFGDNIKNRIRDIGDLQVPSDGNVTFVCDVNEVYFGVYNNGSWTVAIPTSSTEGWQTHLSSTGSTPIIIVTVTQ